MGGEICTACHASGVAPEVTLEGPTTVAPSTVHTYSLRITGGQETAGGLDVSTTGGTLAVADFGTQLLDGEIVHTTPRSEFAGAVVFSFNLIAPALPGTVTLYGAGNSVNLASGPFGDNASATSLTINVSAPAAGPGETSGPNLNPLLVTGYDPQTGNISLTYDSGCEATENNLYFGPLDEVSTYGWSGEVCDVGVGGAYQAFDPGAGSFFFVVVGNKDADEGSYGTDLDSGGGANERPPFQGNACGQVQNLNDACD